MKLEKEIKRMKHWLVNKEYRSTANYLAFKKEEDNEILTITTSRQRIVDSVDFNLKINLLIHFSL